MSSRHFPIRPDDIAIQITPAMTADAAAVANDILRKDERLASELESLSSYIPTDQPQGSGIVLDDISEIALTSDLPYAVGHQLRARMRAFDGDVILSNAVPPTGFEEYTSTLDLGVVEWIRPGDGPGLCTDVLSSSLCFGRLVDFASTRIIYVSPYMAVDSVWSLVHELSRELGRAVPMLGPRPAACLLANDKARIMQIVTELIGPALVPDFRVVRDAHAAAAAIASLAGGKQRLGVRLPSSATGLGLRILDGAAAASMSHNQRLEMIDNFAAETKHSFPDPLLVVRWHDHVVGSPSVHIWIPVPGRGSPICEGVLDQDFLDPAGTRFGGGRSTGLSQEQQRTIQATAVRIAMVLQNIGYIGRCSFDFIMVGPSIAEAEPILVECNGRWGGASVVLTLLNRLFDGMARPAFAFGFFSDERFRAADFGQIKRGLHAYLYSSRNPRGWLVTYHPGSMRDLGRLGFVALGATPGQAHERLKNELPEVISRTL